MGNSSNEYELTFSLGRVLVELVTKMQEMTMDKTELGCLRAIVLFNPDVKGLKEISRYTLLLSCFLSCSVQIVVLFLLFHFFNIFLFSLSNLILLHHVFSTRVEQLRERVYASLEEYTRSV